MIPLVLFGIGGHSKVLIDIAEKTKEFEIVGLFDDNPQTAREIFGYPVLGTRADLENKIKQESQIQIVVAVGNNSVRFEVGRWLRERGGNMATLIHPSAQIGKNVRLGSGSVVMAGVVVNSDTVIGNDVILNTRCSVDHDCNIGDTVHIGPGVSICGGVIIGGQSLLGVGSQVIPGVKIGENVIVAAGATVVSNTDSHLTIAGTPAKKIK